MRGGRGGSGAQRGARSKVWMAWFGFLSSALVSVKPTEATRASDEGRDTPIADLEREEKPGVVRWLVTPF